jgi:hypothetical protein
MVIMLAELSGRAASVRAWRQAVSRGAIDSQLASDRSEAACGGAFRLGLAESARGCLRWS